MRQTNAARKTDGTLVVALDPQGRMQYIGKEARNLLKPSAGRLTGTDFIDLVHERDRPSVSRWLEPALTGLKEAQEAVHCFRLHTTSHGRWRWYRCALVEAAEGKGPPCLFMCLNPVDGGKRSAQARACTGRIEAEALTPGGALCVTETASGDDGPLIRHVNPAFARVTGYEARDLVDQPLSLLHGVKTNPDTLDELMRALKDGATFRGDLIHDRKGGGAHWVRCVAHPIRRPGQRGVRQAVVELRDISDQKRLEQRVMDVGAREQRRAAYDLHDSLQQVLAAAAVQARVLEQKVARDCEDAGIKRVAGDLSQIIKEAIVQTRQVAHGLDPILLETEGLVPALAQMSQEAESLFRVHCELAADDEQIELPESERLHVYRIAQEAMSNAIHHGEGANIHMSLEREGDWSRLTIEDDGRGISDRALRGEQGMGLHIMDYRARLIGASLEVTRRDQGGTRVTCRFPM